MIKLRPDAPDGYFRRGFIYQVRKKIDLALTDYCFSCRFYCGFSRPVPS